MHQSPERLHRERTWSAIGFHWKGSVAVWHRKSAERVGGGLRAYDDNAVD